MYLKMYLKINVMYLKMYLKNKCNVFENVFQT